MFIETARTLLQSPLPEDAGAILEYHLRNRLHFKNAMLSVDDDFFTHDYQMQRIAMQERSALEGKYFHFYAYSLHKPGIIIADVSAANILKENRSCQISYKVDKDYLRQGYGAEITAKLIDFLIKTGKIHRFELFVTKDNIPSAKLAEKLGFEREGIARSYMEINGVWRDHIQYSLIAENNESR